MHRRLGAKTLTRQTRKVFNGMNGVMEDATTLVRAVACTAGKATYSKQWLSDIAVCSGDRTIVIIVRSCKVNLTSGT